MSFSASLRRCAPSATRVFRNEASIAASSSTRPVSKKMKRQQLPPEKLRALISLYHQSDTFITQENLLDKINEALIPQNKDYSTRQTMPGIEKMYEALAERRKFSKVGPPLEVTGAPAAVGISSSSPNGTWSSGRHARERRVIEALYGVDMSNPEKVKPGLELLEGVVEGLNQEAAEDAKSRA